MSAVAITGATRGVGRAVASLLASSGRDLVVNGRDQASVDGLVDELAESGVAVRGVVGSVADDAVAHAVVAAAEDLGGISALVNNAGIVRDRTALRMTVEEFDDVIAVNLRGAWLCGTAAARAMRARGGRIVNVVSEVAFYGAVGQSNYMASKAGLLALTTAWALEWERYGIGVNAVSPAAVTDMSAVVVAHAARAAAAAGRPAPVPGDLGIGRPDEVAPLIAYLAGADSAPLTGQVLSFNGRDLTNWSFAAPASSVRRDGWTVQQLAECFAAGELLPQTPQRPEWIAL